MDMQPEEISGLLRQWELDLHGVYGKEVIIRALAERIRYLLNNDEERLLQLFYRIDIPERSFLACRNNPEALAGLVFDRQLAKQAARKQFPKDGSQDRDLEW